MLRLIDSIEGALGVEQMQGTLLWPAGKVVQGGSIASVLDRMGSLEDTWNRNCSDAYCTCKSLKLSVRERLRKEREMMLEESCGICLDCLRTRGESQISWKCWIKHS